MKLDIFTLFPEAFEWFRTQRSVSNAIAQGNELRLFNYRDTTPLGAGQVDDSRPPHSHPSAQRITLHFSQRLRCASVEADIDRSAPGPSQ